MVVVVGTESLCRVSVRCVHCQWWRLVVYTSKRAGAVCRERGGGGGGGKKKERKQLSISGFLAPFSSIQSMVITADSNQTEDNTHTHTQGQCVHRIK